jgi:sarcosine oxidase
MPTHYDVIIAGIGAMGSATMMQLALRGKRVLGLEKFDLGHQMGSSHGRTRLVRAAYFEGSAYVPMVLRAIELWKELGKKVGKPLFHQGGTLDIAPESADIVQKSLQSCLDNNLAYQSFDAAGLAKRYPAFRINPGMIGLFQPNGGFVESENAILAHVDLALAAGADVLMNTPMHSFAPTADGGVRVDTPSGAFTAGSLIVSAGAFVGKLVPSMASVARPVRQAVVFLAPNDRSVLTADKLPGFTFLAEDGHYYGLPLHDFPGLKIGGPHLSRVPIDPYDSDRTALDEQVALIRGFARRHVPAADGEPLVKKSCIYAWVDDEHFVIDHMPGMEQVVIASPCSGHGYKFASVMGEILADMATGRTPAFDLSMFRLDRPSLAA